MTTARHVLEWAADPVGRLPVGPLSRAAALADPDRPTAAALRLLTRVTAARLGAGDPPFGDDGPVGLGAVLLAAAIGGRLEAEPAAVVVGAVPRTRAWVDHVVRHGVVAPALTSGALPSDRVDALLAASPLTAVLTRPGTGGEGTARRAAIALLGRPRGGAVLASVLSRPSPDPAVLEWRADLLGVLGHQHVDAALDVYVAARLWHGAEWDERIRWAARELRGRNLPERRAIQTLRYWAPLARLHRAEQAAGGRTDTAVRRDSLQSRVFLRAEEYGFAVETVFRHGLQTTGTSA